MSLIKRIIGEILRFMKPTCADIVIVHSLLFFSPLRKPITAHGRSGCVIPSGITGNIYNPLKKTFFLNDLDNMR